MGLEKVGQQIYNQANSLYVDVKIGVKMAAQNENSRLRIAAKTAAAIFVGIFFTAVISGSIGATLTIAATLGIGAFLYAARQESQIRFHEGTLTEKAKDSLNKLKGFAEKATGNTTDLKTDLEALYDFGAELFEDATDKFSQWKRGANRTFRKYMPKFCCGESQPTTTSHWKKNGRR